MCHILTKIFDISLEKLSDGFVAHSGSGSLVVSILDCTLQSLQLAMLLLIDSKGAERIVCESAIND